MNTITLTPDSIIMIVGFLLSLLFKYFPVLRVKYAALASEVKSGIMLGLIALTEVVIVVMGCNHMIAVTSLVCVPLDYTGLLMTFIITIAGNQGTYNIFPETDDVKSAKMSRFVDPIVPA